ncbi:Allophanate hydrolase 2 subunit 2 [Rhodovulum sp. P5]|uniref:5-oxoprolinase subunit C family protein n=1 Tax=Rhodovulum sp. P5 TaxID=1564506 RepID=UPI0009C2C48A|nr:biotin-dependent carboxyltransferase family protein [Rhodovulum sp. P5]ARE41408.1 Allophanate hydrolase 2 subunit 2 [Rhodovulum sp. P5]
MIEVLRSGPANCIQDAGRPGLLHLGISRSGAMDRLSFDMSNALLGNRPDAAAVEVAMFPFSVRSDVDTCVAVTGADARADVDGHRLPPNWAVPVRAGAVLSLSPPDRGMRTYVAFRGGVYVPPVMGSRATDLKSGFGGFDGRGLAKGDRFALGEANPCRLPTAGRGAVLPADIASDWAALATGAAVGVIPAAEFQDFTEGSRAQFFNANWRVGHQADRIGYRLEGPELTRTEPRELFSHGLLPGTVQVPASGQPIIQLADANTCGGYPKIAAVVAPDLWKIAQLGPGGHLRFRMIEPEVALERISAQESLIAKLRSAALAM